MEAEVHPSLNLLTKTQKQIRREDVQPQGHSLLFRIKMQTPKKKGGKIKPHTQQPTHPATSWQTALPASREARWQLGCCLIQDLGKHS